MPSIRTAWSALWRGDDFTLDCPLPPDAAVDRLTALHMFDRPYIRSANRIIRGWRHPGGVILEASRAGGRNSYRRRLHARFVDRAGGSTLTGRFMTNRLVVLVTAVWLGLASLVTVFALLSAVEAMISARWSEVPQRLGIAGFGLVFPVVGIGITSLGIWMSGGDERALRTWLQDHLT